MKEAHQCSSCGGFCKKSGCERANVEAPPTISDYEKLRIENARLKVEAASFHMNYRMKCDIETKKLEEERHRLKTALYKIRQEPSNTMSDSKALKEIIRIARAALGEKS
jgi:hypothetical protein